MFTWSLGWAPSPARLAITSLAFMFEEVPEPVWKTSIGNWSSCSPAATSSPARGDALGELGVEQAQLGVGARGGGLDRAEHRTTPPAPARPTPGSSRPPCSSRAPQLLWTAMFSRLPPSLRLACRARTPEPPARVASASSRARARTHALRIGLAALQRRAGSRAERRRPPGRGRRSASRAVHVAVRPPAARRRRCCPRHSEAACRPGSRLRSRSVPEHRVGETAVGCSRPPAAASSARHIAQGSPHRDRIVTAQLPQRGGCRTRGVIAEWPPSSRSIIRSRRGRAASCASARAAASRREPPRASPSSPARVCGACGMGMLLSCTRDALPGGRAAFLILD